MPSDLNCSGTDFTLYYSLLRNPFDWAGKYTCKYSKRFRKSSQWPGYGQPLAVSWNHSIPTFVCQWGLISPIRLLGCNHPYLHFLTHVCDIFLSALPALFSLFLFPCTGAENFLCCKETHSTAKGCEENCLYKENISSFPTPLNILCAPLRTRDRSVEKSWRVWPDKAKEICFSKSYVGKSSLAHGLMIITNSFTAKPEATQISIFLLRRLRSQMSWKKGKKISLGSVSENKRREYNNVQSQLFLSVAAASVKKCRTLKTGKEVWNCGWAAKLDCIREMMASGCWGKVSYEVLKYQCLWTLVSSHSPFPLFFSPVLAS